VQLDHRFHRGDELVLRNEGAHDDRFARLVSQAPAHEQLEAWLPLVNGRDDAEVVQQSLCAIALARGDNLMMINLGLTAVNAAAAAHVANDLVRPVAVIASHVNERATERGKLRPDSLTARFIALVKGRPVHLAISGRTMEFDGSGRCVAGC
jgi:hypothetical protein